MAKPDIHITPKKFASRAVQNSVQAGAKADATRTKGRKGYIVATFSSAGHANKWKKDMEDAGYAAEKCWAGRETVLVTAK
jgi:hypothetical protein